MRCVFEELEPGPGKRAIRCTRCGVVLRTAASLERYYRDCSALPGPGSHLHALLTQLGVQPVAGCGCGEMMAKMDRGADWCREHREEILAHLTEAYHQASWAEVLQAGGRAVALGLPLTLAGILELAIQRAEAGAVAKS
jgi:hypothetical protein